MLSYRRCSAGLLQETGGTRFIAKPSRLAAPHFSQHIHRSEAPSPSRRGLRSDNGSRPRYGRLQPPLVKAVTFVQRWVTPGAIGLVTGISGMSSVPNVVLMTPAMLPLRMQCAHGYSGCIGVLSIGCQVASRSVAGLSSTSPLRMAVMGRQKL